MQTYAGLPFFFVSRAQMQSQAIECRSNSKHCLWLIVSSNPPIALRCCHFSQHLVSRAQRTLNKALVIRKGFTANMHVRGTVALQGSEYEYVRPVNFSPTAANVPA